MGDPQKIEDPKNRTTTRSSNYISRNTVEENEKSTSKEPPCSQHYYLQYPRHGKNVSVH